MFYVKAALTFLMLLFIVEKFVGPENALALERKLKAYVEKKSDELKRLYFSSRILLRCLTFVLAYSLIAFVAFMFGFGIQVKVINNFSRFGIVITIAAISLLFVALFFVESTLDRLYEKLNCEHLRIESVSIVKYIDIIAICSLLEMVRIKRVIATRMPSWNRGHVISLLCIIIISTVAVAIRSCYVIIFFLVWAVFCIPVTALAKIAIFTGSRSYFNVGQYITAVILAVLYFVMGG